MVKNFVIPLAKDELLTSHANQYFVEEIIPIRLLSQSLDDTRSPLQKDGAHFILNHFDTFFSVIFHGNKVDIEVCLRSYNRIHKALDILVNDLEKLLDYGQDISEEERKTFLCINKMLAYLFSSIVCHIDDHITKNSNDSIGKYKKNSKADLVDEWKLTRQKALELLYRWLQIPLHKLWKPPIVETAFVKILSQVCYKILEQCKDAKQKHIRETIFEILGTLIKRYNHRVTCIVRIIQLVKLYDVLAIPLATGVVHMTTSCECTGLFKEVIKEIGQSNLNEADNRNVSIFLENIAKLQPNLILPILDEIADYLSSDFHVIRNCAIGILGIVVQEFLVGDDLTDEQKEQRDECLNNLEEHILDCHAYVRSKVLQVWQTLCCKGAVPLVRHGSLLAATTLRLEDKSANVRKQALLLLHTMLESNPFAGKLYCTELSTSLKEEQTKLQELKAQLASGSGRGDMQRYELWEALLPDIKAAIKKILTNAPEECDDDDTNEENEENVDPDHTFEHVRQLLLNQKVTEAVMYLWKVCTKLEEGPQIKNLSVEAKEECLYAFLLKIFIDSENKSMNNENVNTPKPKKIMKQQENIAAQKRVVHYLKSCLGFATELEKAIPIVEKLLFSTCVGDAVESCTFLGTAFQFGVTGAESCVRNALFQVFHRDLSVRNNVAVVYKNIYLNSNNQNQSPRQVAIARAKGLINLLKGLQPGQSPALAQLVTTWYENGDLNIELLQVLWEKYTLKYSNTSAIDSRVALMLITMIAQKEPNIITSNLDVLVNTGLGSRAKEDLLLARDTCRMLLNIKSNNMNLEKSPLKYHNHHEIFQQILSLLTEKFTSTEEKAYISFATDALNVIYHLANQPDVLIKKLLIEITKSGEFLKEKTNEVSVSYNELAKLLYIIGHVAIRQMVHMETSVYKELKRRDALRQIQGKNRKGKKGQLSITTTSGNSTFMSLGLKRTSSRNKDNNQSSVLQEDNGEEALEGAVDDSEAEFINHALENEIITGNGLLTKFIPLVLDVCQYPDKYNDKNLQAAGSLALSKMMTVSSEFCEQRLQLLVTILERSPYSGVRSNMLIGLSDLATKFPNQVEPWSKHIYGRLRDTDVSVRRTCVRMLSNLIMREMIRVKGQVSELALCIIDEDEEIRQNTKEFFTELARKGNALYNVVPDILSRLANPELNLDEKDFQDIIKYILVLIQKEKHIDTIIEKICARFKLAVTERQWRDLSYSLSLLQFNGKSIRRLIESLPLLKDKIHYKPVLTALRNIIEQAKKKAETKAVCMELEEKIQELLQNENSEIADNFIMPPPSNIPRAQRKRNKSKNTDNEDKENSDDSDEEEVANKTPVKSRNNKETPRKSSRKASRTSRGESDDDNDDDNDNCFSSPKTFNTKKSHVRKKSRTSANNDDTSLTPKKNKIRKVQVRSSTRLSQTRK